MIEKSLLLKVALEDTSFPTSWTKATVGWSRKGENISFLLSNIALLMIVVPGAEILLLS